jgi:DNA-binding MurR/RpiR family transcriptional regulator
MTDEQEAIRGRLAQDVLENPVYAESYGAIEQEIMAKWRDSRDPVEREELHRLLKMLAKARNVLESTMRTGQLAAAELERKRTLADRLHFKRG